jgi:hypothetical protein
MALNNLTIQVVAFNLEHLVDVEIVFNLACIVFLLTAIKKLMKLA